MNTSDYAATASYDQHVLIGRSEHCVEIDALLEDARAGRSGTLLLRGEAGIGKTSLLDYAAGRAEDMLVLRATGVEVESGVAFAALLEIARPLLPFLAQIPERQAGALRSALAMGPAEAGDRFTTGAAMLSLLAEAAEEQPLLVLVDDAQWVDEPSLDAILFAARRLDVDRVAVLVATRTSEGRTVEARGLSELHVEGLNRDGVVELLAHATDTPVADRVVEPLLDATGGNPLALVELTRTLTASQLKGVEALEHPLPTAGSIEASYARRIAELGDAVRRALLVAAVSETDRVDLIAAALAAAGVDASALAGAEDARLVTLRSGRLTFRHPLVRSAVFHDAAPSERRAAHATVAEVLQAEGLVEAAAWHLGAATLGADERVAAALEHAAAGAAGRSGFAVAARGFERSAALTPNPATRSRRFFAAADNAWLAGDKERAQRLLEQALEGCRDPRLRADIQHLRGHILNRSGQPPLARQLLVDEARLVAPIDPEKAAFMLAEAAEAAIFVADFREAAAIATEASKLPGADRIPLVPLVVSVVLNLGERDRGVTELRNALRMFEEVAATDPRAQGWALNVPAWLDDLPGTVAAATAVAELARSQGAIAELPYPLGYLAQAQLALGRWPVAYGSAEQAVRVCLETGHTTDLVYCLSVLAQIEAGRGEEERCRAHVEEALAASSALRAFPTFVLGFLALSLGDAAAAIRDLAPVVRLDLTHSQNHPILATFDLIEAYVRSGDVEAAAAALAVVEETTATRPWDAAGRRRCHGLIDANDEGRASLAEATEMFEQLGMRFEVARTRLYLGGRLRREGLRREAREHLRSALDVFDDLGAAPWADQARAELRASGETVRRREAARDELTPQELQVALLACDGKTNRDIGLALFLSPKTIEAHLGRVYRKLGIHSRVELVRHFSARGAPAATRR